MQIPPGMSSAQGKKEAGPTMLSKIVVGGLLLSILIGMFVGWANLINFILRYIREILIGAFLFAVASDQLKGRNGIFISFIITLAGVLWIYVDPKSFWKIMLFIVLVLLLKFSSGGVVNVVTSLLSAFGIRKADGSPDFGKIITWALAIGFIIWFVSCMKGCAGGGSEVVLRSGGKEYKIDGGLADYVKDATGINIRTGTPQENREKLEKELVRINNEYIQARNSGDAKRMEKLKQDYTRVKQALDKMP